MLISTVLEEGKGTLVAIAAGLVALAVIPRYLPVYAGITLITLLMYGILTLSWAMFSGPTNYVSLATAALFGSGVYVSAVLRPSLPLPLIVLIGALVAFFLALGIGALTLRLRGVYFILFTFGVTALIRNVVQWYEARFTFTVGRHVLGESNETVYGLVLGIFALTLLVTFLLRHSSAGAALRGIGENEDAARHSGVPVTRVKILAFAGSALFMGATGAVMATRWRYIDPTIAFNPQISFLPVLMAIFGGTYRLGGPLLGAAIFVLLQEYLITEYPFVYMLLFGLTLVVVVLYLPGGLLALAERWYWKVRIQYVKTKMKITMWWRERGED